MKHQFINLISGGLISLLTISSSFSQDGTVKELPVITISSGSSSSAVSAKLNKAFSEFFKTATHLRWYEINKKFLVKFIMNDKENRALFNKNGQLVYHITYGAETLLPTNVRQLVKSKYYDQKITRVLKVDQDKRNIWVINLEDEKDLIMARVEDVELEETQRLVKTN